MVPFVIPGREHQRANPESSNRPYRRGWIPGPRVRASRDDKIRPGSIS